VWDLVLVATVATLAFVLLLGARPAEAQTTTVIPTVDCVEHDADTNILTAVLIRIDPAFGSRSVKTTPPRPRA